MVVSARVLVLLLAVGAARAHIASHDNILRIQLWDADGLSKEPITTDTPTTIKPRKSKVDLEALHNAMVYEGFGGDFGRYTRRHKVRHKRRRPRQASELPWRFHAGEGSLNVAVFDDDAEIEGVNSSVSAVIPSKDVPAPMTLRQDEGEDEEDEEVKKQLPVVRKCCAIGQNLSAALVDGKRVCLPTYLTFQPVFYQLNETHMWTYDSNVFETIIHNPCSYDRYKLDPSTGDDEFYLLVNGSLFTPINKPTLRTMDYCMETFYNESDPNGAGITLPLVCFPETDKADSGTSSTLIAYAIGLIISVPFLLATAFIYTFITELRDTHGKALACHATCLAMAFTCLAATQLAGHAFPAMACTVMAYMIQFSFVSCFFWLNVMCFDTFLNVRRYINCSVTRRSMRRRFAWYCAYAVLLPLILLIVTITMELSPAVPSSYLKPNFGVKGCWFKTDKAALPYFYGPVSAILLANIVIFFFTSRALAVHYDKLKDVTALEMTHSDYSTSDDWVRLGAALGETLPVHQRTASPPRERPANFTQRLKKYRKIFRTCCMLSVIMGLSWVMEVVSWAVGAGSDVVTVWSLFDVINALQGVVIFGIFVLQQPVRGHVKVSLSRLCRRTSGSEVAVVSERTSIDCGTGRRDYV